MVGDILRQERERQNLTIKDIEHGTSIRAVYIEAIENGDYEKLPGNVYTKGFIKNYGNFLKIDGDSLSRQFMAEVAPPPPPPVVQQNDGTVSKNETAEIIDEPIPDINGHNKQTEPDKIKYSNHSKSSSNTGLVVAAVILIAAIAGGLWYYFTNIEGKELAQSTSAQTEQQNSESNSSSSSATPASAQTPPDNTNVPTSNFDGVNIQAKFTDRCWTKVIADGRVVYEGIPEPGETLSWQAKDRISVTAGNAGAVEFIENGNSIGVAGNVGAVVEKTFLRK